MFSANKQNYQYGGALFQKGITLFSVSNKLHHHLSTLPLHKFTVLNYKKSVFSKL